MNHIAESVQNCSVSTCAKVLGPERSYSRLSFE